MDVANRWTTPDTATPTYKAMKIFRNYDGNRNGFGDTSVAATVPNPDEVSAFASIRTNDGALTVMVINKVGSSATTTINLANFTNLGTAQIWQLTAANQINRLADASVVNNQINATLPPQSVTLFVVAAPSIIAPTNLSGARISNSIKLDWQDNSTDEDGFVVERANETGGEFRRNFAGRREPDELAAVGEIRQLRIPRQNFARHSRFAAVECGLSRQKLR